MFNGGYLTRDKNSCIASAKNMLNITKAWIYTKTRPEEYQRNKKFEIPKTGLKKKSSAPNPSGQTPEDKLIL